MILPILAALAAGIDVHPFGLMIAASVAASCAFMLPVATPPNAIIFGSGRLRIADMARVGLLINLIGVLLVTLAMWIVGRIVFDIDLTQLPVWAH